MVLPCLALFAAVVAVGCGGTSTTGSESGGETAPTTEGTGGATTAPESTSAAPATESGGSSSTADAPSGETVKVGVLHSLSGTMAISETSLRDVVLMAIEEINAAGGVLGKQVEPVVVDPASDWDLFAEKAQQLITTDDVAVTFGCWTSVSRKSVLPVFEEQNALLFYPVQYEGEEQSLNVFYTGASPNQQLIPAAEYLMSEDGGEYKKFYLLGTDYVFPRTANKVLKAFLKSKGVADENIIEEYTPFHHQEYQTIVGKIKAFAASGDACVLSTINGDSNVPFYKEFANQGLTSADCPVMAFSVAEDELRAMDVPPLVGTPGGLELFPEHRFPRQPDVCGQLQEVLRSQQFARWRCPCNGRSHRGGLLRRLRLEGGGRESR